MADGRVPPRGNAAFDGGHPQSGIVQSAGQANWRMHLLLHAFFQVVQAAPEVEEVDEEMGEVSVGDSVADMRAPAGKSPVMMAPKVVRGIETERPAQRRGNPPFATRPFAGSAFPSTSSPARRPRRGVKATKAYVRPTMVNALRMANARSWGSRTRMAQRSANVPSSWRISLKCCRPGGGLSRRTVTGVRGRRIHASKMTTSTGCAMILSIRAIWIAIFSRLPSWTLGRTVDEGTPTALVQARRKRTMVVALLRGVCWLS